MQAAQQQMGFASATTNSHSLGAPANWLSHVGIIDSLHTQCPIIDQHQHRASPATTRPQHRYQIQQQQQQHHNDYLHLQPKNQNLVHKYHHNHHNHHHHHHHHHQQQQQHKLTTTTHQQHQQKQQVQDNYGLLADSLADPYEQQYGLQDTPMQVEMGGAPSEAYLQPAYLEPMRARVSSISAGSPGSPPVAVCASSTRSMSFSGMERPHLAELCYVGVTSANYQLHSPASSGSVQVQQQQQHQQPAIGYTSTTTTTTTNQASSISSGSPLTVSPTPSGYQPTSVSMSASDALNLGINLEQYISKRNERERSRVRNVNDAFDNLKNSLPLDNDKLAKRMSKVEILRSAIGYIRNLEDVLGYKQQREQTNSTPISGHHLNHLSSSMANQYNNNNTTTIQSSPTDSLGNIREQNELRLRSLSSSSSSSCQLAANNQCGNQYNFAQSSSDNNFTRQTFEGNRNY